MRVVRGCVGWIVEDVKDEPGYGIDYITLRDPNTGEVVKFSLYADYDGGVQYEDTVIKPA